MDRISLRDSPIPITDVIMKGSGGYIPSNIVTNDDLVKRYKLKTDPKWISEHLGIEKRSFALEDEQTSDLAFKASQIALDRANISAKQLDWIILCTTTPDHPTPATAARLQYLLKADCPAEDKQVACSGFMFGIYHAISLIHSGLNKILIVGVDIKSRFVSKTDERFLPIFADGAGAIILEKSNTSFGFKNIQLWTDGKYFKNIYTNLGGSVHPISNEVNQEQGIQISVTGKEIYEDAVFAMVKLSEKVLKDSNLSSEDIDHFIPHQANFKIMKQVALSLSIPIEKVINTIQFSGNIVNATLPFAYFYGIQSNRFKKGDKLLFVTAGGGYSGGAAIYIHQ
ncbi:MAG: ketoacyl-ACP synthase III [Leptospiraceae bacterium]|nr:ketoacyl-ACP synthase III [Leptospiraceae bacterium]